MEDAQHSFTWYHPTRVIFGRGTLASLPATVDQTAGSSARIFLATGRTALRSHGILQRVLDSMTPHPVTLFDRVLPFPSPDLVDEALAECRRAGADVVVAIGGGSAMDLAKAVAVLMAHQGTARQYALREKALERRGLPFIAVPTTSGSSSEVTKGAALWDMEARRWMGLGDPLMYPTVAIVDPELAMTMPRALAAATGMDAFTSAFESYWSTMAQPLSDALNLQVIRLYSGNLERSCNEGDAESRSRCAQAATISGMAYSHSSPNICHVFASPLTLFWRVEHGQAVCITLPALLRRNAPFIGARLPALWNALGVRGLDEAVTRLTQIIERCGLETRLSRLGVGEGDLGTILDAVRWERTSVLPSPMDRGEALPLLRGLL